MQCNPKLKTFPSQTNFGRACTLQFQISFLYATQPLRILLYTARMRRFFTTGDWMLTTLALRISRRPLWHMLAGRTSSVGECALDPIFLEFRLASWLNTKV